MVPKRNYMPARKTAFDELDYQIICALHTDARLPAADIARRTGSNERTVRKRIDRLVAGGAVRLTAILDPVTFGYHTAADIFLETDPALEEQIVRHLIAMPEVADEIANIRFQVRRVAIAIRRVARAIGRA